MVKNMKMIELIKESSDNILLFAEGGAGKSAQLVFLYKKLLENADGSIIPIYIPLREYNGSVDFIKEYIISNYFVDARAKKENLKPLFSNFDGKILLLLDGLNETSCRKGIYKEIQEISEWKNVQVLLTSRYNEKDYFKNFANFTLQKIDEKYLGKNLHGYNGLNQNLKELLHSPFYFTKYKRMICNNEKEFQNAAQFLQFYYQEMVDRILLPEYKKFSELIIWGFVPYLCFKMSLSYSLRISIDDIKMIFNEWYIEKTEDIERLYIKKGDTLLFDYIETMQVYSACTQIKSMFCFHEINRDFFAAYYEKKFAYLNRKNNVASFEATNYNIMKFEKEMLEEYEKNRYMIELRIPYGVSTVAEGAFLYCGSINYVKLSESVEIVGRSAFRGCGAISKVKCSERLVLINDYAFASCVLLREFTFPKSLRYIGQEAFASCVMLNRVHLPEKLEYIDIGAFSNEFISDFRVEGIFIHFIIKSKIKIFYMNGGLFQNLSKMKLEKFTIEPNEKFFSYNNNLYEYNDDKSCKLKQYISSNESTSYEIPEFVNGIKVSAIDNDAFYNCENLKTIYIPRSVTQIGIGAFTYHNMITIRCHPNSYAHKYAIENGISIELV